MSKFKVTVGDQVHEVDSSSIEAPENFVIADTSKGIDGYVRQEVMDSTIADRVSKAKTSALKDAHRDESIRNQVFSEFGIELGEDGKPKLPKGGGIDLDKAIEKERDKWFKNTHEPVLNELDGYKNNFNSVTSTLKKRDILSAFATRAEDAFLDDEFGDPYVVTVLDKQFKFNEDLEKTLQVDKDGNFERHPNGSKSNGHGFIEPKDFIELNADSSLMKKILKDNTQGGSGLTPGGGGSENTKTRQQVDALSPAEATEFFAKGGKVVD